MALQRTRGDTIVSQAGLAVSNSYDLSMDNIDACALQVTYTDATPVAKTFLDANVNTTSEVITITAHGFFTGLKVAASNAGGTLPGGLSTTNYYVIVVTSSTIKLASTLALAVAGTPVDITSAAGGGTHSLTPAALGGIVVKLQTSNDGTNFADLSSYTVTISAAGTTMWNLVDQYARYVRILHTPSAGAINLTVVLNAKALS